jgi:subtilisin-like proprotein convertase family protein
MARSVSRAGTEGEEKLTIKYTKGLAVAAGLLAMAVGAARIHAAVTIPSTDVPKVIADLSSVTSTLNFTVTGTITDANLLVNIRHTWDGDVGIQLRRPGGADVVLWNGPSGLGNCGGSGDNFTNTVIDDEGAAPNCTNLGPPYTGNFQGAPNGTVNATTMTAFDTFSSGGVWTLTANDDVAADTGTLLGWSLTLDGAPPLPVELMKLEVK